MLDEKEDIIGDYMPMTLEEFLGEPQRDGLSNPIEEVGAPTQYEEYDLHDVDFTVAVRKTHERVLGALRNRVSMKDYQLKFFSDWTGRGKTSGVVLATGTLFESEMVNRVLFITREIAGVDDVWRQFAGTWPEIRSVGFSSVHSEYGKHEVEWPVYRDDVTKTELKQAQIVITTHSMAKAWMAKKRWDAGKDFDLVIVDEYPDPVQADTVTHDDILRMRHECRDKKKREVWAEIKDWSEQVYNKSMSKKPTWLDKVDDNYPERLVKLVKAAKVGRLFATKANGGWTVLQWADLHVPFEEKAIIFSATNDVEGWQFDPTITQGKIAFGMTEQPTNYEGLTVSFAEWPDNVPVNNKTLGDHIGKSLTAIEKAIRSLPKDGEEVLVLAPKSLCDGIPEDWLDRMMEERDGALVYLKNWGAGIGSNAYKDCYHMIVFGLYHPNVNALKQNVMGHKRHKSQKIETGTFEGKAMQIARSNWHKRWVVQMLNRIRIRKMVSGGHDLEMYRAQDANIIWIATDKDQDLATDILTTSFRGCNIKQMDDLDLFEDLDEPEVVAGKKTTEAKVGFILSKLDREGITGMTLAQMEKRFGWKPKNKKGRDKTATRAKEMGWYYAQGQNRKTPAQLLKRE